MSVKESTLIVDDNIDASRLLAVLLAQLGETAICKHNGAEALDYLKDHTPRLILLDAIMPRMSGIEVLQAIRRERRFAAVPVVMMSRTMTDPAFAEYAMEQGAAEFWIKSEVLYKNVKQLVAPYLTRLSVMSSHDSMPINAKAEDPQKQKRSN
jgi:CheY-like chemotaxis protein